MKKLFSAIILLILISPALAATNDFTADGNITVSSVTFGAGTADMLILDTSTAESWSFSSGTFTVTNPGTFIVGSSDSAVKSIKVTQGGSDVACAENTTPGTSYVTLPTSSATYTVEPYTSTDCTSLCTSVSNAATLNSFPTCGAATCNSGYTLSGSGASATCVANASSGTFIIPVVPPPITPIPTPTEPSTGDTQGDTTTQAPTTGGATNNTPATIEQMLAEARIVDLADVNRIAAEASAARDIKT